MRTVVEILTIFEDILGGACGKAPAYTTVWNRMLKLGFSVYEEDKTRDQAYAMVMSVRPGLLPGDIQGMLPLCCPQCNRKCQQPQGVAWGAPA